MPAHLVITARIHDRAVFIDGYAPRAAALVERFGGRYIARGPVSELLEGPDQSGLSVVVSEWPDRAVALAFWNSADYREVARLREGIADCQVLLIE